METLLPNRITGEMSSQDAIIEMSEGNPGALSAMLAVIKAKGEMSGLIFLCHLDDKNIYGSDIWIGYKDICECDVDKFYELGSQRILHEEINKQEELMRKKFEELGDD